MKSRLASCSCGQLKVRADGEPSRVSVCHCLDCQRRSGSVFAAQARFRAGQVQVEGLAKKYVRAGVEGGSVTFSFCPDCGSTVFYTREEEPGVVAIAVGAFADPGFPQPRTSIFRERQHGWVQLADSIEQHD